MAPRREITAVQAFGILAERIQKRICVLRAVGLSDGFGVAVSELEIVLRQIQKARDYFASLSSSDRNR